MAAQEMGKKSGEKSNFRITCNLLSQYLKEKGSFGGLGLEAMSSRPLNPKAASGNFRTPTTMSLLPGVKVSEEEEVQQNEENAIQNARKSIDLFPQKSDLNHKEDHIKPSNLKEAEKGQLTIFYGGKVLVFDEFPASKAKDLMLMASQESIAAQSFAFPAPTPPAPAAPAVEPPPHPPVVALSTSSHPPPPPESTPKAAATEAGASDMPIARRNSLHRFLEKRKDRICTKAPYQLHGSSPPPPEDGKSWLGLGREVSKPENSSGSSR